MVDSPITDGVELADVRGRNLYKLDKKNPLRFSHAKSIRNEKLTKISLRNRCPTNPMNCYILIMKHGKCRIRDNIDFSASSYNRLLADFCS